jgi:hypothetical protein
MFLDCIPHLGIEPATVTPPLVSARWRNRCLKSVHLSRSMAAAIARVGDEAGPPTLTRLDTIVTRLDEGTP